MRKIIIKSVAILLVAIMIVLSAPLQEMTKLDFSGMLHTIASALENTFNPYHDTFLGEMHVVEMTIDSDKYTGDKLYTQNVSLGIGDSETIYVSIVDENGEPLEKHDPVEWTANPASAVALNVHEDTKYCDFTILETTATQVTITARYKNQTLDTVIDISNNEVRFTSSDYYILVGSDKLITSFNAGISASAIWTKSSESGTGNIENSDFTFSTSDDSVLSVDNSKNSYTDSSGIFEKKYKLVPSVYGKKEGTVTLTVETSTAATASCTVTVVALKEYKIEAYSEDLKTPLANAAVYSSFDDEILTAKGESNVETGSDGVCTILLPDVSVGPSYPVRCEANFHPEQSIDSTMLDSSVINRINLKSSIIIPGVETNSSNISALSTEVGEDIKANLIDFDAKLEILDKVEVNGFVDMSERKVKATIKVSLDKTKSEIVEGDGRTKEVREQYDKFETLFEGLEEEKVKNVWKNLREEVKTGKVKYGIEAEVAVVGYIEFDFSTGECKLSEGGIMLIGQASFEKTIYTEVPAVIVTFKIEGEVKPGLKLIQTKSSGFCDGLGLEVGVEFTPGVSVAPGIGCDKARVSIGVEGKLKFEFKFVYPTEEKLNLEKMLKITATLSGFIELKFELWIVKFKGKLTLAEVEAELYPELDVSLDWIGKSVSENEFELMPRDYLTNDSLHTEDYSSEFYISNVYPNSAPQIANISGNRKVAVWLEDNGSKSSINRTTLVYSIYNNGYWSNAEPIYENGKYDGTPKLCSDGNTAHLLWMKGAKVFSEDDTFDDFSKNTELMYSSFSNSTWSSPKTVKGNNGKYTLYYSIAAYNGNATVSWTENSENDVFLSKGTTTVFQKDLSSGLWSEEKAVVQTTNPINSIASGYISGEPKVACSIDTDGVMTTFGDKRVYIDNEAITPDDGSDYLGVSYVNDKFYFSSDYLLCMYDGSFTKTDLELSSVYQIAENNGRVAVITLQQSGYYSELMASYSDDGVSFTNPVYITEYGQNVSDFDVALNPDGSLTYCLDLSLIENDEFTQTDFIIDTFSGRTEVSMSDAAYDMLISEEVKNTIFYSVISNDGTTTVNGFDVKLMDTNNKVLASKTYDKSLKSGEKVEVLLSYDIPTSYDGSDFRLVVTPEKDTDWTNNEYIFNFGYADLVVENCDISPDGNISATITNKGYVDAQGVKASIYTFNGENVLLHEMLIGNIARGDSLNINYQVDEKQLFSDSYINYRSFMVEASSDGKDINYANNSQSALLAPTRVTDIKVATTSTILAIGDCTTIEYEVLPASATDKRVYWFTDDDDVATVDSDGKVTGIGLGTTTIKAVTTDGHFEDVCTVTVSKTVPVNGVLMQQTSATVLEGETRQLTATVLPENATNKTIIWSSDKTEIATVSADGLVTAKKSGTAKITAKTSEGNYQAFCTITVTKTSIAVTGISISDKNTTLNIGETKQLAAEITPLNATNYNVLWSSNNTAVATVSNLGVVTAIKSGYATITATTVDGGYNATCLVTVTAPSISVTGIAVFPSKLNMKQGDELLLSAEVYPANATNKLVTWKSDNPDIATVSSSGLVTAVSKGTTVITVTTADDKYSAKCEVIVNESSSTIRPPSIEIRNYTSTLKVDYKTTITFTAMVENLPNEAVVQWYKDDVLIETGETCTIKQATNEFNIQAKILLNGAVAAESQKEKVEVNKGFFARIIAFFKMLFGLLPVIVQ